MIVRRRVARRIVIALAGLGLVVQALPAGVVAAPVDRLPDLAMGRPLELRLVRTADGHRRLRFTSLILNLGKGPFETLGYRKSLKAKTMPIRQRIYDSAGGHRTIVTTAVAKYAGDGHDHWHVQKVARYELFAPTGEGPALQHGAKVGFCFFDTRVYRPSLPRSPAGRKYFERGCGTKAAHSIRIGLSVGWSDIYPWNFAWQWVDMTGLAAGQYFLKLTADPEGSFLETREDNNCNWTRIKIPKSGSTVTVVGRGSGCRLPGEPPPPTPTPSPTAAPTPTPTPTPTATSGAGTGAAAGPLVLADATWPGPAQVDEDSAATAVFSCRLTMTLQPGATSGSVDSS
jgi:hypothetical protein